MTQKTRQTQLFTGGVFVGDMDNPVVKSDETQAKVPTARKIDNIVSVTQAEYDSLAEPDASTIYLVAD
jgi:hypothetical protein